MFVLVSRFTNRLSAVYGEEPEEWDRETQFDLSLPDEEYKDVKVQTREGQMPFLRALMVRTGAFRYEPETGELKIVDSGEGTGDSGPPVECGV